MIRISIAAALVALASPALAAEKNCYRGGMACDCATFVCEGDNKSTFKCPAQWAVRTTKGKIICEIPGGVALIAQPSAPRQSGPAR